MIGICLTTVEVHEVGTFFMFLDAISMICIL